MALLGSAAMLLWYDIVREQIGEHDDWHTREHFPERLGVPGFIRTRRVGRRGIRAPWRVAGQHRIVVPARVLVRAGDGNAMITHR